MSEQDLVSSLISGSAETSASFAGGQTLRSGGLCSMSSVRQSPAEVRLFGNDFQRSPASLDEASFLAKARTMSPGASWFQ
jgi:hypothetical protein